MAVGLLSSFFLFSLSRCISLSASSLSINLSLHNLPEYRADSEAPREREGKQANPAVRSPAKGHKSSQAPSAPVKQLEWEHAHTHTYLWQGNGKNRQNKQTKQYILIIQISLQQRVECEKCLTVSCCPGAIVTYRDNSIHSPSCRSKLEWLYFFCVTKTTATKIFSLSLQLCNFQEIVTNIRNKVAFVNNEVIFTRMNTCLTYFNKYVQHQSCDNDFRSRQIMLRRCLDWDE